MKKIFILTLFSIIPFITFSQSCNSIFDLLENRTLEINKIININSRFEKINSENQKNVNKITAPFKVNYSYNITLSKLFSKFQIENCWLLINDSSQLSSIVIRGTGEKDIYDSIVQRIGKAKIRGGISNDLTKNDGFAYSFWDCYEEGLILYFTDYLYVPISSKEKQPFLFVIHNKNPSEYLLYNINR